MKIHDLCKQYGFNVIEKDTFLCIPISDMLQYTKIKYTQKLMEKMIKLDPSVKDVIFNYVVYTGQSHTNKKFIFLNTAINFIVEHGDPPDDEFATEFMIAIDEVEDSEKAIAIRSEHNLAISTAHKQFHPMMTCEAVAPMVYDIIKVNNPLTQRENRLPIFSKDYPFKATQKFIDFVKEKEIRLIEPTFNGITMLNFAIGRFEMAALKSLVPFYHISQLVPLFDYMSEPEFAMLYIRARQELLILPEWGCTDYEFELRDRLIQFELDNNFLDYEVYKMTPDIHEMRLSYFPKKERKKLISLLEDGKPVPRAEKPIRIVFLHNKTIPYSQFPKNEETNYQRTHNYNIDTLFKEEGYEPAHEYLQANLEKFGLKRPKNSQLITREGDCVYSDTIKQYRGYLFKTIRVPIYRMCSELQAIYSHRFSGLDIDVDEEDLPQLSSIDWYMRKDGEHLIIYRKKHDNTEEEMKYFLFSKLISELPEYKIVIITPRIQSCMCRRELTILRLHTATNKNGYEKSIPHTIIKQRFEKYNAMSYQTICKLYQNALVVNGAQEILPQFTTTGLFTEVVPGNDWLSHEQMLRYRVPEQHNLLPNNDCNTEKIMTPLQTVDSANGTDDPSSTPLVALACDIDINQTVYLTQPERLKLA